MTLPRRTPPSKISSRPKMPVRVRLLSATFALLPPDARGGSRCPEQAGLVPVQEDQHVPLAEGCNAQGVEPSLDLAVRGMGLVHGAVPALRGALWKYDRADGLRGHKRASPACCARTTLLIMIGVR